jgi:hypothetical protein
VPDERPTLDVLRLMAPEVDAGEHVDVGVGEVLLCGELGERWWHVFQMDFEQKFFAEEIRHSAAHMASVVGRMRSRGELVDDDRLATTTRPGPCARIPTSPTASAPPAPYANRPGTSR